MVEEVRIPREWAVVMIRVHSPLLMRPGEMRSRKSSSRDFGRGAGQAANTRLEEFGQVIPYLCSGTLAPVGDLLR